MQVQLYEHSKTHVAAPQNSSLFRGLHAFSEIIDENFYKFKVESNRMPGSYVFIKMRVDDEFINHQSLQTAEQLT